MQLEKLNQDQVERIYKEHLIYDFPEDERKPLPVILGAMERDRYDCYSLIDQGEMLGYAFFVRLKTDYLLDYLAVLRGKRNQGYGSVILGLVAKQLKEAGSVIAEVEDPKAAADEAEKAMREKRIRFYMRNGFLDTGVIATTFGVRFKLIRMPIGRDRAPEEWKKLYKRHYRAMLPAILCWRNVKV